MEKATHLSSCRRTGKKKKKKKTSLRVRGSVGSPTSAGQGPIEVKIYGITFLLLQGFLVGGERGSKNINTKVVMDALNLSSTVIRIF